MARPASGLDDYLDWQERLDSFQASGLSIDVFCLKEGVSRSTFCRWKKQLEQGIPKAMVAEKAVCEQAESAEGTAFVPMKEKVPCHILSWTAQARRSNVASSALDEGGKAPCADRLSMTSGPAMSLRMTTWT